LAMTATPDLEGNLTFVPLADLFQLLGGNNSTGVLHVTSPHISAPATIYFQNGDPINATNGDTRGTEAVNALFGWMEGVFRFYRKDIRVDRTIKKSRMQIVLDALRLLDDGEIPKVGPPPRRDADQTAARKGAGTLLWKSMPLIRGPVIDYMYVVEEETFPSGKRVVTEGRHGNWIWILLEGEVEVLRDTTKGPVTIARLGEGSFIGTFMIFLFEGSIRSAHVTAVEDVRLGLLDTQKLYAEFASLSAEFRNLLLSLSRRLIKTSDRVVDLFTGTVKTPVRVKDKELFLKMGSVKEEACTIAAGEAVIVYKTKKGGLPLLNLERGDVLGNLPFANPGHEPHSASVFASKGLETEPLDLVRLQGEHDRLSLTFRSLLENLSTSISITTRLACHIAENQ